MTNLQLQQVRRALFLDVREAVEHVKSRTDKKMSVRAWQYWEQGKNPVPADVEKEMIKLAKIKESLIKESLNCKYQYFRTYGEFLECYDCGTVVMWRLMQSVAANRYLAECGKL